MRNMAHYPTSNSAAKFIGGAIMFVLLAACMVAYVVGLYYSGY